MPNLTASIRSAAASVPGARRVWGGLNRVLRGPAPAEFSGWGMQTQAHTPWHHGGGDDTARDFLAANEELLRRVASGEMVLTQMAETPDVPQKLRELMWRHYVVFWTARYAAAATAVTPKTLVECGVCDGLSSWFAMSAVASRFPFRSFLYDAWQAMEARLLSESERVQVGAYSYLSLDTTRNNLSRFREQAVFIRGFIPEVFETAEKPPAPVWLHIDLNSSAPTRAALAEFLPRMPRGSVVLFDDYGWQGFDDTKAAVDQFVAAHRGQLLPMPTGQAMFFVLADAAS